MDAALVAGDHEAGAVAVDADDADPVPGAQISALHEEALPVHHMRDAADEVRVHVELGVGRSDLEGGEDDVAWRRKSAPDQQRLRERTPASARDLPASTSETSMRGTR